jgi:hypothetical protein
MLVDYFLSPQAKLMLCWILSPHLIKRRRFVSSTSRISPTRLLPVRECLRNSPSYNETNDMPFVGIDHPRLLLLYPLRYFTRYSVNSSTTARITNPQQPTTNLSGHCRQQCPDFLCTNRPELLSFGRSYAIRISKHSYQKLKGPDSKPTEIFSRWVSVA